MASLGSEAEAESLLAQMLVMGLMGLPHPSRIVPVNLQTRRAVVLQSGSDATMMEGSGTPPASKASMEAMRKLDPHDLEPDQECPVCLMEIVGGGSEEKVVREMPCKHRFHEGCIKKWLGMHGSCPVCRFQMPVDDETTEMADEEVPTMLIFITVVVSPPEFDGGEQEGGEEIENSD